MPESENKKLMLIDRSYSGIIKREIKEFAMNAGIQKVRLGELEVVVSELLTNVLKYGNEKAQFLVKKDVYGTKTGIEIICIDSGRGMVNPAKMLQDGVSTSNSLGQGLGAIKRFSDEFDLYSLPRWGTIVLSRIYQSRKPEKSQEKFHTGSVLISLNSQENNGDSFYIESRENSLSLLFTDGLGHGPHAHKASKEAIKVFRRYKTYSITDILNRMHHGIKQTRGIVCFLLVGDIRNNQIRYCGVGNISAFILSGENRKQLINHNGIVGYIMPSILKEVNMIWQVNDLLVIHSDGISSRWDINSYPEIERHDPAMLAAALYKDFGRSHDDNSIIVIKRGTRKNFYSAN